MEDWRGHGGLAWAWQTGLVMADWPGHGGLAWAWRTGLGMADWPGHGGLTWSWRTGLGMEDWSGHGGLAWAWRTGVGMEDWRGHGGLTWEWGLAWAWGLAWVWGVVAATGLVVATGPDRGNRACWVSGAWLRQVGLSQKEKIKCVDMICVYMFVQALLQIFDTLRDIILSYAFIFLKEKSMNYLQAIHEDRLLFVYCLHLGLLQKVD